LGLSPLSWSKYKSHPLLTEHHVTVGGVEHWPRAIVHQYQARRTTKTQAPSGRPTRSGHLVPATSSFPSPHRSWTPTPPSPQPA
ncbi:hypothetical protein ACM9HB_35310, partial [Streptomyces sp. JAC128]